MQIKRTSVGQFRIESDHGILVQEVDSIQDLGAMEPHGPYRQVTRLAWCLDPPVRQFARHQLEHALILHYREAWAHVRFEIQYVLKGKCSIKDFLRNTWQGFWFHLRHGED